MYSSVSPNEMVGCPYNPVHRMLRSRLQPHLIKCRKSYPDAELQKCPFDSTHLIPEPEFIYHVENCPGRALITNYKYSTIPLKQEDPPKKHAPIECDENWDDTEVEDYDPKKYASQAKVIRAHIGDLPSVKKEFRRAERKRLGDAFSDDEDVVNVKKEELVIKKLKRSSSDEEDEVVRAPTPPVSLSWPAAEEETEREGWYEDSRGRRDFNRNGPDYMRREQIMDDDPYYNGEAGTSNSQGSTFSRRKPDRGYGNRHRYNY